MINGFIILSGLKHTRQNEATEYLPGYLNNPVAFLYNRGLLCVCTVVKRNKARVHVGTAIPTILIQVPLIMSKPRRPLEPIANYFRLEIK